MEKIKIVKYKKKEIGDVFSKKTIEFHNGKHHVAYQDNYNNLIKNSVLNHLDLIDVMQNMDNDAMTQKIKNNAGGVYNHNLYFEQIEGGYIPLKESKLKEEINSQFGGMDKMLSKLTEAGLNQFGSGWSWLILKEDKKTLDIVSTANQDCPLSDGLIPLIAVDVWEHAYYLDFQNKREDYIKALYTILNWDIINQRYIDAKK